MVGLELFQRHGAREHHNFNGELVRPEVVVEEMHGEQEHHREERFFTMEDGRDVEDPSRQEGAEETGQPHDQAAHPDDGDTPERCPVVELLPIGPAVELRTRSLPEEPLEHCEHVLAVLQVRNQRVGAEELESPEIAADAEQDVEQMPEEDTREDDGRDPVNQAGGARPAEDTHDRRCPGHVGIEQRHAREREDHQADSE